MVLPILAQQNSPVNALLPFIILAALIYFFGIRPVSTQKKKQEQLHGSLNVGDDVVTIGAWKGTIVDKDDEGYWLRLSEDTTAYILKAGIARKVIKESDLIDEDWTDEDEDQRQDQDLPAHLETIDESVPSTDNPKDANAD